jgi:hypothetical protein
VFDDLKDYLSDSDLSLDYKIALRRRKPRSKSNASNSLFEFSNSRYDKQIESAKNLFDFSNKENHQPNWFLGTGKEFSGKNNFE